MIITEIFYAVKCNRCDEVCDDTEHSFWVDENTAIENATDSEWIEQKGKHYCPNCCEFNEETEEQTPKPDFPKHIKNLKKFLEKIVVGVSETIIEKEDCFIISLGLYNRNSIENFEENYIKEFLGGKFISIECRKHERYTKFYLHVTVKP